MQSKNRYTYINDNTVEVHIYKEPDRLRSLVVGQEYEVQPANPNATHHRGRKCTIIEFNGSGAKIKFLDTKRYTWVQLDDLGPESEDRTS